MAASPLVLTFRAWLAVLFAFWLLTSCGSKQREAELPSSDPAALWRKIIDLRNSNRALATRLAEQGYKGPNSFPDDWRWRFRLRHAELLADVDSDTAADSELKELQKRIPPGVSAQEASARLASLEGYLQADDTHDDKAVEFFDKAVSSLPAMADDPCWGAELLVQHQAQSLRNLRRFPEAEEALQKAEGPARACSDKAWSKMIPLVRGNCANDQSLFENAAGFFQESFQLAQADNNARMMAIEAGLIALAYSNLGDSDHALEMYEKSDGYYAARKNQLSESDLKNWGVDIGHRARTYFLLKNYAEAERLYNRAIKIATDTKDEVWLLLWQAELTSLYIETGNYQSADKINKEIIGKIDFKKDSFGANPAYLNDARLKRIHRQFEEAEKALNTLQNQPGNDEDFRIIWQVHMERARVLADTNRVGEARREFEAALNAANEVRSSIKDSDYRLTYFLQLQTVYRSYVDFLAKQNQAGEALRIAEMGHARLLVEKLKIDSRQNRTTDFKHIAKAKNAVILSYSISPQNSYMWVTTPTDIQMFSMPAGAQKTLEKSIADHNVAIRDQYGIDRDSGGRELYQLLVGKAAPFILPESNVIVIPDGPLSSLNFETLIPPGGESRYWLESNNITVAPALTLLTGESQRAADPASILLVGDAIATTHEKLPPLGRDDLDYIASLYPKSKMLSRQEATPSGFVKVAAAKQYSWLYLSAHAISYPQSPLDSYVVLSPETTGGSYKLSARDLTKLGLNANLVTLSACQSAGAKNVPGEGLVGLSWAVLSAGAKNVVASLWPVEARSTSQLMKKFYSHMHQHESPAQALRSAKIEMIHSGKLPYTWAAFELYSR